MNETNRGKKNCFCKVIMNNDLHVLTRGMCFGWTISIEGVLNTVMYTEENELSKYDISSWFNISYKIPCKVTVMINVLHFILRIHGKTKYIFFVKKVAYFKCTWTNRSILLNDRKKASWKIRFWSTTERFLVL